MNVVNGFGTHSIINNPKSIDLKLEPIKKLWNTTAGCDYTHIRSFFLSEKYSDN